VALIVQKFGGTSVATIEKIRKVATKIKHAYEHGHQLIVVVSAMGLYTDELVDMAKAISANPAKREYDVLLATGEQITIALLSMMLIEIGCPAQSFLGFQVPIITNDLHSKATILEIPRIQIQKVLNQNKVAVVAGFQGITNDNSVSTLGRGGSDTTAVALAAAFNAEECQIYTDVDGVYTVDPNIEPNAKKMSTVTFAEMLELASLGANVLQMRAVEHACRKNVSLRVLSTFSDNPGTLIVNENHMINPQIVSGIAVSKNEAKIVLFGVPNKPGVAGQIIQPLSDAGIDIDMIIQAQCMKTSLIDFTFTLLRDDFNQASAIISNLAPELGVSEVKSDQTIAKLSIVGLGMRTHPGIASKMFTALGAVGVNIQLISTSEIKVSVLIDEKYLELGVRTLAEVFELSIKNVI
jgi:aspartate kinase